VAGAKPIIVATSAQVRRYFSFIFSPVYDGKIFGKKNEKISWIRSKFVANLYRFFAGCGVLGCGGAVMC